MTLVPDEPPINITAEGIEPTVIKVNWSPVPYETINGVGIGYKLAVYDISGTNIRNYILNASVLVLEITGLEIWTNYSIKMAAFTVVGDGPWSDLILEDTDEERKLQAAHSPLHPYLSFEIQMRIKSRPNHLNIRNFFLYSNSRRVFMRV